MASRPDPCIYKALYLLRQTLSRIYFTAIYIDDGSGLMSRNVPLKL